MKTLQSIAGVALVIEVLVVSIVANHFEDNARLNPMWFDIVVWLVFTILIAAAVRIVAAAFSRHIRTLIMKHPIAHMVWFGFVLAVVVFAFFAGAETRALGFGSMPPPKEIGAT